MSSLGALSQAWVSAEAACAARLAAEQPAAILHARTRRRYGPHRLTDRIDVAAAKAQNWSVPPERLLDQTGEANEQVHT